MRRTLTILALLALTAVLNACHEEDDDLFTMAVITLGTDQPLTLGQVQAQAQLTNINTRQVTTTADFNGPLLRVEVLRGAYQVSIEGVVTCHNQAGATLIRQFRAQADYVELAGKGTVATTTLNMIFLD